MAGDELEAYIADGSYAGTGNVSGGMAGGAGKYRYGFNGKENDNEVKGSGNQQDYGMRIYDPRIAKFLSVDPLEKKYAFLSPYQFAANTPIRVLDKDGEEPLDYSWKWNNMGETKNGNKWEQEIKNVHDNWTKQVWSVMSYPNHNEVYYWKPYDGSQGTFDFEHNGAANKDINGKWTGVWQRFERQETIQARLGGQLVDAMSTSLFAGFSIGAAMPAMSVIGGGSLIGINGARDALVGGVSDLTSQVIVGEFSGQEYKINWASVAAGMLFKNPFTGSAVGSAYGPGGDGTYEFKPVDNIIFSTVVGGFLGSGANKLMNKNVIQAASSTPASQAVVKFIADKVTTTSAAIISSETQNAYSNLFNPELKK